MLKSLQICPVTAVFVISAIVVAILLFLAAYVARPTGAARGSRFNSPVRPRQRSGTPDSLVVATFNMHGAKGIDGKRDLRRSARVVEGADIVALQEVHAASRFWGRCQAEDMALLTGMGWLFAPTRRRWFRDHRGNALLSVFPVCAWHREPLPHLAGNRYRNLTTARIRVGDRDVSVLFTHLHTRAGRELQLSAVLQRFNRHNGPAILLGDLNTRAHDPQLRALFLDDKAQDALRKGLGDRDQASRVDWIVTKGLEIVDAGMRDCGASDHPYYWARVRFRDRSRYSPPTEGNCSIP